MKRKNDLISEVGRGVPAEPCLTLSKRKPLGHECPSWVTDSSVYFITICTAERGDFLTKFGHELINSVRHLHELGKWYGHLWVVMPDHVHGLISLPPDTNLDERIAAWKRYASRMLGISWQECFFDHRLRSSESMDEKYHYVEMNPVRAGLVVRTEDWPYVFYGSAGTPRPTKIGISHA